MLLHPLNSSWTFSIYTWLPLISGPLVTLQLFWAPTLVGTCCWTWQPIQSVGSLVNYCDDQGLLSCWTPFPPSRCSATVSRSHHSKGEERVALVAEPHHSTQICFIYLTLLNLPNQITLMKVEKSPYSWLSKLEQDWNPFHNVKERLPNKDWRAEKKKNTEG